MKTETGMPVLTRRAVLTGMLIAPLLARMSYGQEAEQGATPMRVRIVFGDEDFTATLEDHASAREFALMLPLDLTISDYSNNEKIAYLSRKLTDLTRGPFPSAGPGDLCYYVPWGNLAFFHGAYDSTRDLVRLGRLDGDVTPLLARGEFSMRVELL